jgi:hypothetical protein
MAGWLAAVYGSPPPFVKKGRLMRYAVAAIIAAFTVTFAGCAARGPQRLDLIALQGQSPERAVTDQRDCEAEFPYTRKESTLQAYAACLIARGYISEVPLSPNSGTKRITVYVRPDRGGRVASEIRSDITACDGAVQRAYNDVPPGYRMARWVSAYATGSGPYGGGVNIQRDELIQTFARCMAPRGYTVGDERQDVVPGR